MKRKKTDFLRILVMTLFLAAAVLLGDGSTAQAALKIKNVSGGAIWFDEDHSGVHQINVDTSIKRKNIHDIYSKDAKVILLQYLKGKEATVSVYANDDDSKKQTIKVNAQARKVKAKFLPKTYGVTVKVNGSEVKERLEYKYTPGNDWVSFDDKTSFEPFTMHGVTLTIRVAGKYDKTSMIYTPDSKEIKVKIPARKAGPSVIVDPNSISISLPKGCSFYVTDGEGNVNDKLNAVSQAAVTKTQVINLSDVISRGGLSLTEKSETSSYAAIIRVQKQATDKVMQSKDTVLKIPYQDVIVAEEAISSASGISYTYKYNLNKTAATGITVINKSSKDYLVGVIGKDVSVDSINLTAKTGSGAVKWFTVKAGKSYVLAKTVAVEGGKVLYRVAGVKANKTKKIDLKLASTIVQDRVPIEYPAAPKNDLGLTFSKLTETVPTASGTAITIQAYPDAPDGSQYVYEVGSTLVKNVKIGETKAGATVIENIAESRKVTVSKGQYITAYLIDADNKIISYCSKQVMETDLY